MFALCEFAFDAVHFNFAPSRCSLQACLCSHVSSCQYCLVVTTLCQHASTGTHHSKHDRWDEKLVLSRFNSGVDNHFI
jgi:hypothetical protein